MNQLPFLLPWIRVALLIRSIRTTTFDEATWPTAKTVLARALAMRIQIAREGGGTDPAVRRLRAALGACGGRRSAYPPDLARTLSLLLTGSGIRADA